MSEDKAARLREMADELVQMTDAPLYDYRRNHHYRPVLGEGSPDARIMFIGEAPGKQEAQTGRPFVGAAGRVLDELLETIGLDRDAVYITNIVKDRPPDNRDPTREEIAFYTPLLERQLQIIQPRVIATLGRFAMDFILRHFDLPQAGHKISDLHGQVLHAQAAYGKVAVVPLFHPAAALYQRSRRGTLEEDMAVLRQFMP